MGLSLSSSLPASGIEADFVRHGGRGGREGPDDCARDVLGREHLVGVSQEARAGRLVMPSRKPVSTVPGSITVTLMP